MKGIEDKAVDKDKIEKILRAAMAAPSAGNQQDRYDESRIHFVG